MSRAPRLAVAIALALLSPSRDAHAQPRDPAAARAQLEQGYELKKQGRWAEALPHLQESVRLDATPKALLNLADCEEHVAKLVDAAEHWIAARDRAGEQGLPGVRDEAQKRLVALQKRLPRLTVRLAPDAPQGTEVLRDEVTLGAVSLGTPLPADPGMHALVVRAPGRQDARYDVPLSEGEQKSLTVAPGPALSAAPTPSPTPAPTAAPAPASSAPEISPSPSPTPEPRAVRDQPETSTQAIAGYVAGGVGAVGLLVGAVEGLQASARKTDVQAHCDATTRLCDSTGITAVHDGRSDATVSTIGFVVGGVGLVAGAGLLLFAPSAARATTSATALWISAGAGSIAVGGSFR